MFIATHAYAEGHALSSNFINRIEVDNDRISEVIGNQGEYIIDSDGNLGQIFIIPRLKLGETMHMNIITESDKIIDFEGKIEDIEAQSITLSPEGKITMPDKAQIIELLRKATNDKLSFNPIKDPGCFKPGIFIEGWEYKTSHYQMIKLHVKEEVRDFSKCSRNPIAVAIEKTAQPTIYIVNNL